MESLRINLAGNTFLRTKGGDTSATECSQYVPLYLERIYITRLGNLGFSLYMSYLLCFKLVVRIQIGAPPGLIPDHAEGTGRLAVAPIRLGGDVDLAKMKS